MRKILLGTTAVCGAALMGMGVAQAQTAPTVRVGGYFEFNAGYVEDNFDNAQSTGLIRRRQRVDFRSDMELNIFITGKAANGLSYGAQIELQMDAVTNPSTTGNGAGTIINTDEVWGFISSPTLGTLQFGDQDSAADQLKVSAPSVTNLGESGNWQNYVGRNADNTVYITSTINDGNDSTKLIYLSPQFFGFDFGASYSANGNEGENFLQANAANLGALQRNNSGLRNEISGAVRYRGSFGNVGFAAALSAMRGDAPAFAGAVSTNGVRDPYAFQAGANVSAYGFTLGGHYVWGRYAGDSFGRTGLVPGLDNSNNWTVGLTYTTGALQVGGFYARGKRDILNFSADREQQVFGVGAVYTLAPGLEVFANYTNIEDENVQSVSAAGVTSANFRNRDIDVIIIGTRLAF